MRSAFPALSASSASSTRAALSSVACLGLLAGLAAGCAEARLPDPKLAAVQYAEAARAGDSERIYALLSREAQRDYGRQGTRRLVEQAKAELSRQGAALLSPASRVQASAEIRFEDGESALFELEGGAFHVSSLGTVPSRPRSPSR